MATVTPPPVHEVAAAGISTMEILTLIAIIVGPIIGAWIATVLDNHKSERARRLDIFRTLMRTRNLGLSIDHVSALNLVEVEFMDNKQVLDAWRSYLQELAKPPLTPDTALSFLNLRDEERRKLLAKLLSEIAGVLNLKVDKMAVFERNYTPQGWQDDDGQQKYLRVLVTNLLSGRSPLPVVMRQPLEDSNSPYPEPPQNK